MGWFSKLFGGEAPVAQQEAVSAANLPIRTTSTISTERAAPLPDFSLHRRGRAVVVDCETTGFSWAKGDRIVSLAGIEVRDGLPTGLGFSLVFNPGRPSAAGARRVHGLPDAYLALQNPFANHAQELRHFIGDDPIVAHNATFDLGFLNNEFTLANQPPLKREPICTMWLYRARFPGSAALDVCCARYSLDSSSRAKYHGAFIDAALTAALYQGLTDPREPPFHLVKVDFLEPTNAVGSLDEHRAATKG
ncbi:MAG TPA: exonuclease domain-containing protein [Rhizomicrobium sp.]|nr:exonuclease domain-containing protein [Rhizomicrobium sp.]